MTAGNQSLRFAVRVKPRSSRDRVGGTWGDGALVVAVAAPAVDGKANAAVLSVLADELGVKAHQLEIVAGHHHRSKIVEVVDPPASLPATLDDLRAR